MSSEGNIGRTDSDHEQSGKEGLSHFLDVETTREGKPYPRITESRKGREDKWERNSINVFPEDADEFAKAVSVMASKLG